MNFRKLAAIDIVFLGYKIVLTEYLCGVLLPVALGVLSIAKSHSVWQSAVGAYLLCLGFNYTPMLIFALSLANRERAESELGDELGQRREVMARYRKLSVLLLVPLLVPLVAMTGTKTD